MNAFEIIKYELSKHIQIDHLEIVDETGKHLHHRNFDGGFHLKAQIVSKDFNGLPLLERHQLVYKALSLYIKKEIHALSIKAYSPTEWFNQNKDMRKQ